MQATEAQKTVGDNWRDIVDPRFYTEAGWPSDFIDPLAKNHQVNEGDVFGVWHAEFLQELCKVLGVDESKYKPKEGWYSQCKAMALAIWIAFYEEEEKRGKK